MKNIKGYRDMLFECLILEMDGKDIIRCMDTVKRLRRMHWPSLKGIFGDYKCYQMEKNDEWTKEEVDAMKEFKIYPDLYTEGMCHLVEFPLGEVVVDVTPFRDAEEEIRPVVWVNGQRLETPNTSIVTGLYMFQNNPEIDHWRALQSEKILKAAENAKKILDDHIKEEISESDDLYLFSTYDEMLEYFKGDVSWLPNGLVKRGAEMIQRSYDLFGED